MKHRLKKHFRHFLLKNFPTFYSSFSSKEIHDICCKLCELLLDIEMATEVKETFDEWFHEMGFELVPDIEKETETSETDDGGNMTAASIDMDEWLQETDVKSELLSDDQRRQLHQHLPPRTQGYVWNLVFSTQLHGFSLRSLYRKSAEIDRPVLMVIQCTDRATFGAFISCPPAVSKNFQGTGETWLFTFFPDFKVYKWTGENDYFVQGSSSSLVVGSSETQFGLWLDENFNMGASQAVSTFDNDPLPGKEEFRINNVECWTFA